MVEIGRQRKAFDSEVRVRWIPRSRSERLGALGDLGEPGGGDHHRTGADCPGPKLHHGEIGRMRVADIVDVGNDHPLGRPRLVAGIDASVTRGGSAVERSSGCFLEQRRPLMAGASNRLVELDYRPGHQARFIRCEKGDRRRQFVGFDQAAEGLASLGLFEPVLSVGMEPPLDRRPRPACPSIPG